MKKILVGIFLTIAFVGCKEVKKSKELNIESEGKNVIGYYYYYVGEDDYDKVFSYVDESFLTNHPKDAFIAKLKEREATLGSIDDTTLVEWKNTGNDDKKNKTKEFLFKYDVKYSGGETKTEEFTVVYKDYKMLIHTINLL